MGVVTKSFACAVAFVTAGCSAQSLGALLSTGDSGSASGSPTQDGAGSSSGTAVAVSGASAGGSGSVATVGKRGLAFGYDSVSDLNALSNGGGMGGVTWWQNWTAFPDKSLDGGYDTTGVEYVPTIWGGLFDPNTLATQVPATARYVLTFNLPNFETDANGDRQANLTPAAAASHWPAVVSFANSHSPHLKIVSPSVDDCAPPAVCVGDAGSVTALAWLDAFLSICVNNGNCQVDFIGIVSHKCLVSDLITELTGYENEATHFFPGGKPLWITSFTCQDANDASTTASYLQNAVPVLEQQIPSMPVFRYAWFTGRSALDGGPPTAWDLLGTQPGSLTSLGEAYVTANAGN